SSRPIRLLPGGWPAAHHRDDAMEPPPNLPQGGAARARLAHAATFVREPSCNARRCPQGGSGVDGSLHDRDDDALRSSEPGREKGCGPLAADEPPARHTDGTWRNERKKPREFRGLALTLPGFEPEFEP